MATTTTKTLNIRMQSKYDTLANWTSNNPVLLEGEVAYVVIPASSEAVAAEPIVLTKVGDGTSNFNALSYVGALAADVYSWAKAEEKPSYEASEIEGLEALTITYQVVKVEDNDYAYKLQSKTGDGEWVDVEDSVIVIPEFDPTTLEEAVAENTAAIEVLNGDGEGSVVKAVADAIANIVDGADEKFDTLKEISDFLLNDTTGAAGMTTDIATLKDLVGDTAVAEQITNAINSALGLGTDDEEGGEGESGDDSSFKFALATELAALATRVEANETAISELSEVARTGDISDLVQEEGAYVIFNCGSSSEVI